MQDPICSAPSKIPNFLADGGEMGAEMRARDWESTGLGAPEFWPQPLKAAIRLILNTGHPMYIWWGPELLCFYNDAYSRTLGPERHPGSLGLPGRDVWAEIWHLIGDQVDYVMAGRGSTWDENRAVPITRFGRLDEIYWTYSYSPIDDEAAPNGVGGVLVVCTETTQAVLAERRRAVENERLSRMFEQAPGFRAMLDGLEHRFVLTNPAYTQLVGGRDVLGKTVAEALPEAVDQGYLELLDKVYSSGEALVSSGARYAAQPVSGAAVDERYVDFVYQPVTDTNDRVTGIFVDGYDVTARVLAERRQDFWLSVEQQLRGLADPVAVIEATSEALGRHLGVAQVGYAEVQPSGETVVIEREWNDGTMPSNTGPHQLDEYGPMFIADLRRGETVAVSDVRLDRRTSSPDALATFARASIRAFLDVPLVKDGHLVAVLAVHSAKPRTWSSEELSLAAELADQTWAAAERARAQISLREAEERYLALFNAIDQGFCTIEVAFDDDGTPTDYRFLEVSPAFERQTGIENGVGRWMRDIAPGQDEHWFDTYGRVALTGVPVRFENYSTPLDRWWDVYAFRISGPCRIAVLFRDTTDQKRAEAALSASEGRLRFVAQVQDSLFRSTDAFDAMRRATELLGLKLGASRCAYADVAADSDRFWIRSDYNAPGLESSVGEYSLDLFGPRAATDLRAGRALVVNDVAGELAAGEGREMFQSIAIDAIICCPLIKDGQLTAMMAVHQDRPRTWTAEEVSLVKEVVERCWAHVERVGAEARLRESEERLRLAVDNAELGFWDVDVVNDRLIWPAATKAMFGISASASVTMQDFYDGLHPEDRERTTAAYLAAADPARRALYDVEYRTIGKDDGVVRWVAAKGRGVFDATGECRRVTGTAVQITARKEAEEALRELNATLETRIATAIEQREEAQNALRQSQKMEAMGQLTGGVAHDFNNLLTPIIGSLDMLQRKGLGDEREQRLIAGAALSAERAKTLVQRLLAFARRQPLQPVPVDVAKLVHGMGDLVSSTTGPQIRVAVEAPDDLPSAKADPNQLEMAILNLAVNARDAMPNGGTLRITAHSEEIEAGHRSKLKAGLYICLSVADTGDGMDEPTLARAVEPFFSTKGIGKGTGLGLSMVHGLASQLGGAITIQSTPGLGTNVELWLPQSLDVAAIPDTVSDAANPAVVGTALLVDDEELVRMSTADMLHDLGYTVIEAASGEEAMQLLRNGARFDLLVTDHLMPGINGTDLALAIRSELPGVPVLLVSGYAENEGIDPRLPRLTKPFRKDELATSLSQLG